VFVSLSSEWGDACSFVAAAADEQWPMPQTEEESSSDPSAQHFISFMFALESHD
jgi:hypothetical protein